MSLDLLWLHQKKVVHHFHPNIGRTVELTSMPIFGPSQYLASTAQRKTPGMPSVSPSEHLKVLWSRCVDFSRDLLADAGPTVLVVIHFLWLVGWLVGWMFGYFIMLSLFSCLWLVWCLLTTMFLWFGLVDLLVGCFCYMPGLPLPEGEHCRLLVPGFDMANHDPRSAQRFPRKITASLWRCVTGWWALDEHIPFWRPTCFIFNGWVKRIQVIMKSACFRY